MGRVRAFVVIREFVDAFVVIRGYIREFVDAFVVAFVDGFSFDRLLRGEVKVTVHE
jgi:hypothetical protein